jgi:hypothetical protein
MGEADVGGANVRFTPESGHVRCNSVCPLCAKSGHRFKFFDHLSARASRIKVAASRVETACRHFEPFASEKETNGLTVINPAFGRPEPYLFRPELCRRIQ